MSNSHRLAQPCYWVLQDQIGKGGNGTVYRGHHRDAPEMSVAIKVLNRGGEEAYKRFRDEVAVLKTVGNRPGILPLLDANVPDYRDKVKAWLVMPIAEGIRESLAANPSLEEVVVAIAEITSSLADLKSEYGISHRDIKPGNLYKYNGAYAVGDFGLVTFPDKEAITEGQDRLGPLYFQAPEMLNHPDTVEGEPADIYSLAKTLWVLATGDRWPQPGLQRRDYRAMRLGTYIRHPRIVPLEILLECATHPDPKERPSLGAMRDELYAWLATPQAPSAIPDLSTLLETFNALTDLDRHRQANSLERVELVNDVGIRIQECFDPISQSLKCIQEPYVSVQGPVFMGIQDILYQHDPKYPGERGYFAGRGQALVVDSPLNPKLHLVFTLQMAAFDNGKDYIVGASLILDPFVQENRAHIPTVLWMDSAIVQRGSATEDNTIALLAAGLAEHLPDAVYQFNQLVTLRLQTHGDG